MMVNNLWKWQLFRGIIALIFAFLLFVYPGLSLILLISIFGAFFAISGIINIIGAFKLKKENQAWKLLFFEGLISFIFGLAVWLWPGLSSILLVYLFAAWLLVTGILQLADAIRMSKFFKHTFWVGLLGIISIFFGFYIAIYPGQGALALVFIIAIYATLYGILAIASALALRNLSKSQSQ